MNRRCNPQLCCLRRCWAWRKAWARSHPGYIADIVAVDGDPLADIEVVITKVRWVMKAGSVVVDKTNPTRAR